ncbi:MAG: hypothetical protein E3K36_08025 [Candidatus Brocadia sp.]|nr:hypothetical protein [Candidatus Brocadia sp.]
MKSKDKKWALFWCKLLHPVIFGEIEKRQTNQYLKNPLSAGGPLSQRKAEKTQHLYPQAKTRPVSQRRVSVSCTKDSI